MTKNAQSRINELVAEVKNFEEKYKRALADYQNLERRTEEQKKDWANFAKAQAVLKLLPILDTLMLAEKHTQDQNFTLLIQQFIQILDKEGFKRIKTEGEIFDPLIMEPVEKREGEDGKILEEFKPGFKLGDMVVRPAYVAVGSRGPKVTNIPSGVPEEN